MTNKFNPKKLHHSKWTAVKPVNKEKHFLVSKVTFDEEGDVESCVIEAVISSNAYSIDCYAYELHVPSWILAP